MKYLLALDAGSGSCRSVIFTIDGKEIGFASREWYHPTLPQYPGSQVFETSQNWKLICESIKEALGKTNISSSEIAAVSTTSMRFGSVLFDEDENEIWAAPNTDARANEQVIEALKEEHFEIFYRITGDGLTLCDLMRWMWVKKQLPEVWRKVKHFTLISDWVLYRLSGRFVSDPSIATSSGIFDISKRRWSEEIAELYSIPLEMAPEINESGTVIGEVTAKASQDTGLARGTPVVVGGGDTMAGLVGSGVVEKGTSSVIGGSHWQQTYLSDKPIFDSQARIRVSPYMIKNLWMLETNSVFIGLTMRWFRDAFCGTEKTIAKEMGVDTYYLMEKMAEKAPPGSNGLITVFANLYNAKQWVHAAPAFIQFDVTSPDKFGKKEFIRRIEEDAALQSFGNLNSIWDAAGFHPDASVEIVFSGGASKGFLWPQILADVLGLRVKVPVVKEATAFGAAICAGVGLGIYNNVSDAARELVKWDKTYEPDMENHETYLDLYNKWRKAYEYSLNMADEGIVKPMWRPQGTVDRKSLK